MNYNLELRIIIEIEFLCENKSKIDVRIKILVIYQYNNFEKK